MDKPEIVETQFFTFGSEEDPFVLQHGRAFFPVTLAYETMGELNENKDNAILIFHALSGTQHFAGYNETVKGVEDYWVDEVKVGWWDTFVGPGKAIDTDKFFVVCANYLGGCYGSTGPHSINPETGKPYGSDFPSVTAADIVDSQVHLLDHLGIQKLHGVIGASIGGLLCITFASRHPDRVDLVIPISSGFRVPSLTKIFNFEQICAIEQDPKFNGGDFYEGDHPKEGLTLARMIAHKNYVSLETLKDRARSEIVQPNTGFDFYKFKFPIESYMKHQGSKFVERFDANTYLRIIDAWQCYDYEREAGGGSLADVLKRCKNQRYMIFSVDSDVCFYPEEQWKMVKALKDHDIENRYVTIHSDKGHDAFLIESELFAPHISYCLNQDW